ERNTLKMIFRLSERGYLAPDLGRMLSEAYAHLRTVEHRLQILHEFQTHTLPSSPLELGRLARRVGIAGPPVQVARAFQARHRRERCLSAAGPRAGLVELLAGSPELLTGLVRVCAGGDLLTQLLIAQPELLALLAVPERLLRPKAKRAHRAVVAQVFAPLL